jgi:hypothetical protein
MLFRPPWATDWKCPNSSGTWYLATISLSLRDKSAVHHVMAHKDPKIIWSQRSKRGVTFSLLAHFIAPHGHFVDD